MAKATRKNITPAKRAAPDPIKTESDLTAEQERAYARAEAAEQPLRARAFDELENQVYALTLAARLAKAQVERAINEFESECGTRDLPDADLAIHAVDSLAERAKGLEDHWIRLHNEACEVGQAALCDLTAA